MPTLHRISDDQIPAILALLSASGGTARTPQSWAHDHMTALALGERAAPSAVMPMSRRTLRPTPAASSTPSAADPRQLSVGWLSSNQFASRISLRRQTRNTAPTWPELLTDLDALLVVRRDEPSRAARWYADTGFHDVLSIRCLYLDMDAPPTTSRAQYHVQVVSLAEGQWNAPLWQSQMRSVYHDVYNSYGGAPLRSPDFWRTTLAHHYYSTHYQFQIIGLWSAPPSSDLKTHDAGPSLMGYAIVGWSGWHSKRPRMDILELATRQWDTAVAAELIHTTCQLAWSKNVHQVRSVISVHDPYRGHLTRTGFIDRWGYAMLAKWLHPQRYLDRIAPTLPQELGDFSLQLSAPGQVPLTLRRSSANASAPPTLALQTDPRTLARLLLNRTDIAPALHDGTLLAPIHPLPDTDLTRLSLLFPWTPWLFHLLDYI